MTKVKTLKEIVKIVHKNKKLGKTIGLITGCFDIIHIGHIDLFRFAKKKVDILIVCLENDKNIRTSKGEGRPIFNFTQRAAVLSEITSIDLLFKITKVFHFGSEEAKVAHENILKTVRPDYLITSAQGDSYVEDKRKKAKSLGIKLLVTKAAKKSSSTKIIQAIESGS